jgi:hypothetical protein
MIDFQLSTFVILPLAVVAVVSVWFVTRDKR